MAPPPYAEPPASFSITTAAAREILLDVEGYTALKMMDMTSNDFYPSKMFTVGGYSWGVFFYPNNSGHISVKLVRLSEPENIYDRVGVRFGCRMMKYRSSQPLTPEIWQSSSYTFSELNEDWGFPRFAAHDVLEAPGFLEGDCFTLSCTVSVLKEPEKKRKMVQSAFGDDSSGGSATRLTVADRIMQISSG